jgi:hypothetical protein
MAHMKQSGPNSNLGFQVKVLETVSSVPGWEVRQLHIPYLRVVLHSLRGQHMPSPSPSKMMGYFYKRSVQDGRCAR